MEQLTAFVLELEKFMYSEWFVVALLGTGVLLSVRTGLIQFRKMGAAWKMIFQGAFNKQEQEHEGDITPFQALSTALAATVGLGNIAGVATALALGGPGAIFWMWITALLGMATIYGEAMLAIKFRSVAPDGSMAGGPMHYIEKGLGNRKFGKALATVFAATGTAACLLSTGCMMQSNSIALSFNSSFGVPFWATGIALSILTGLVTIKGIKRIGVVVEKLVPLMIFFFIGASLLILIIKFRQIPAQLALIVRSAFQPMAAVGGFAGAGVIAAMQFGVSRGVLSNEAGLGSSPIAHGAAKEEDPDKQGILAMNGVFIDTIIVCTMTALVILISGKWTSGMTSTPLAAAAFESVIPHGHLIVTFSALLFGFSTLLGWSYYGEQCIQYLLGLRIVHFYRFVFILFVFTGAVIKLELVWSIGTIANACMALPNLVGLVALSGVVGSIALNRRGSAGPPDRDIPAPGN
ncbi:MAG: sodium:alanine symporter family protein [Candidatus Glassbacteria bacterium]|nr:sodium:alanine symporter family protein [Candidatus Glassbacteria bacterium]